MNGMISFVLRNSEEQGKAKIDGGEEEIRGLGTKEVKIHNF
jgi:hypothetical protein